MTTLVRLALALVSAVSALYFVFWIGGAILMGVHLPLWLSAPLSIAAAAGAWRYVWLHTATLHQGFASSVVLGAMILGGIGFAGGFFGPLIFMPESNQGPLLGFITGPLGFVAGAVAGAVYWLVRGSRVHTHSLRRNPR